MGVLKTEPDIEPASFMVNCFDRVNRFKTECVIHDKDIVLYIYKKNTNNKSYNKTSI